jgi:hypothetical protein
MSRRVVDDCRGVRWTVWARKDRYVPPASEDTRRIREPTLQAHLGLALAVQPGGAPALPWADTEWTRQDQQNALLFGTLAVGSTRPIDAIRAIVWLVRVLNEPTDCFWVVELMARGRIRRGATWRVADRAEADRVAAVVANAVRAGLVPEPDGAQLIDVKDERLTVYGALR